MKILRPQPSSVMKERCGCWGEGGHLSVVVSQLWGDALYLFFSLRVEWNVITSRWRLLWKCSVYITACSKGTKRIFFLRIHFLSSSEHYQAKKKKHTHTHTAHTCVIFLCSRSDVTVTLIQSNQKTLVEIILVCRYYFRYMLVWLSLMHQLAGEGGTIGMSHFSQFNLCCLSSDSFILCPLPHSVSHWFSLSASGPHEYLASSHARSARYALTFCCLILVSKKGFNQKSEFSTSFFAAHGYKNIHRSLKIALFYSRHTGGICCGDDAALFPSLFQPDLSPCFTLFLFFSSSFSPLSFHPLKVSVTPAEEERFCEIKRDGEKKKKRKKTDRKRQWVRVPRWVTGKTRRGSDGLICVSRPFLTLSPELSGGSREVRVDEHFFFFVSYITIIRSASRLTLFLFSPFVLFPIYPIASLPSLSTPALSLLLSHWCDTHTRPLIFSSLSHTHTHTLSLSLSLDLLVRTVLAPSAG